MDARPIRASSTPRITFAQFELTTRCNFNCFYCAGRNMPQTDMPYELFEQRLQQHVEKYGVPAQVSLQGEGEPTLHHDFFRMAERVRELGSQPYTITNGTYKHPEHFIGLFPSVGISIDTLDAKEAESIGRFNLSRVLEFADALRNDVKIVVHSTSVSASADEVARWCDENGLAHVVQSLQQKEDYRYRYPERVNPIKQFAGRFDCSYLAQPFMRYYSVSGIELPCSFIKDTGKFPGMAAMRKNQLLGMAPVCCDGCEYCRRQMKSELITKIG